MIYPIVKYPEQVLLKKAEPVTEFNAELKQLADDMFESMYAAEGIGLAAPQIGKSIRLFIVDGTVLEDEPAMQDFKKAFINPQIIEETGDAWEYEEGCLSIPNIREKVARKEKLKIKYFDEAWNLKEEVYDGLKARIIQHEYDHIEGKLFIDYLKPLKRKMLKGKLDDISKGKVSVDYKMVFPK